jgi:hypothetical protein
MRSCLARYPLWAASYPPKVDVEPRYCKETACNKQLIEHAARTAIHFKLKRPPSNVRLPSIFIVPGDVPGARVPPVFTTTVLVIVPPVAFQQAVFPNFEGVPQRVTDALPAVPSAVTVSLPAEPALAPIYMFPSVEIELGPGCRIYCQAPVERHGKAVDGVLF